ncbi:MAG: hypothetical protein HOI70_10645, partial [Opitutae bacterium]|nr:hypothetical protein [Opitutae bacterium]
MNELKALVYCSDIIPTEENSTSGGGLRSLQIMDLLRQMKIKVHYLTPEASVTPKERRGFKYLGSYNQKNQGRPLASDKFDMIWWCNPGTVDPKICKDNSQALRCVDFHGPTNLETVHITGETVKEASNRILCNLKNIDVRTFVSETQRSYWMGFLSSIGYDPDHDFGTVVNLAMPFSTRRYKATKKVRFVFVGGWHPWLIDENMLIEVANIIAAENNAELHFIGGEHAFCKGRFKELAIRMESMSCVTMHGFLSHEEYLAFMKDSACALDIFNRSYERYISISTRTVEFISQGIPMLHPSWTELAPIIKKTQCGWTFSEIKGLGDQIRNITRNPSLLEDASKQSQLTLCQYFNPETAKVSISKALDPWLKQNGIESNHQIIDPNVHNGLVQKPSILWITFMPEGQALRYLRVENILMSLYISGVIDGYCILSGSHIHKVGVTENFEIVCTQREGTDNMRLREILFSDRFVVDIDDLLFVKASYRGEGFDRWEAKHYEQTRELIKCCSTLSVTSSRLAKLLENVIGCNCLEKSWVTPNGLLFPQSLPTEKTGKAEAMIWTSSDFAALDESKDEILEACSAFCRDYNLPVFLFGNFSQELQQKLHTAQNFGMVNFLQHKQIIEGLSGRALGVAPLETKTDQPTLDFIAGKSDLKMLEYGGYGIEGVYSASPSYLESDLLNHNIVDNTFSSWRTALQNSYEQPFLPLQSIKNIREK